jgi:hypothetical protein
MNFVDSFFKVPLPMDRNTMARRPFLKRSPEPTVDTDELLSTSKKSSRKSRRLRLSKLKKTMAKAFGNAFNKSRDNSPLRITKKSSTGSVRSRADSLSIGSPIGRAFAKKINGAKDVIMRT